MKIISYYSLVANKFTCIGEDVQLSWCPWLPLPLVSYCLYAAYYVLCILEQKEKLDTEGSRTEESPNHVDSFQSQRRGSDAEDGASVPVREPLAHPTFDVCN